MDQSSGPVRGPDSTGGRETAPERRALGRELRTVASCLWVGRTLASFEETLLLGSCVLVCAEPGPLPGAAVGRQGSYFCWPHVSIPIDLKGYRGFVGLSMWSLLKSSLEKSGVEGKPSEAQLQASTPVCSCQKLQVEELALCRHCLRGCGQPGLRRWQRIFKRCSPGSSASWCSEKLLLSPILYHSGLEMETQETLEQGRESRGGWDQSTAIPGSFGLLPRCWQHSFLWKRVNFAKKCRQQ